MTDEVKVRPPLPCPQVPALECSQSPAQIYPSSTTPPITPRDSLGSSRGSGTASRKESDGNLRFSLRRIASAAAVAGGCDSSFGDRAIDIGNRFGYQRAPGRLGRKSLKKKARGPRVKPAQPGVLEKLDTKKLLKFWNVAECTSQQSAPLNDISIPIYKAPNCIHSALSNPVGEKVEAAILPIAENRGDTKSSNSKPVKMDPSLLAPGPFEAPKKDITTKDAQDMYKKVLRNAERSGSSPPPYEFIELIGKGAFGRVYKCRKKDSGEIVAVKISDIDETDYEGYTQDRGDAIDSFSKEVGMLRQLQDDSRARNVLRIFDAFDFHSQLWIVSEYCTGGSIRTLMRANSKNGDARGLEEEFIIPLARELMVAIKSVHDIGFIHRDLKCANVYVTEDGEVRLGDFGIVGEEDLQSKRKTVIGTPHHMPPEMVIVDQNPDEASGYGKEVDIWSFGCTVYEMATGQMPMQAMHPKNVFSTILQTAPRLEGSEFSEGLRDFVAFCVNPDAKQRPTADQVLQHPYIANTSSAHPTSNLVRLVERYTMWEYKGGQRQSLLWQGGAPAPGSGEEDHNTDDNVLDWNFSTSDNFNNAFNNRYSQMMATQDFALPTFDAISTSGLAPLITKDLTPLERIQNQHRELSASRGERSLERLWNPDAKPYELHTPIEDPPPLSDLPLRNMSENAPTRESMIDLDSAAGLDISIPTFNFDFGDVPTLKARAARQMIRESDGDDGEGEYKYSSDVWSEKRTTMDWKFPTTEPKRDTMDWKFPKQDKNRATMDWTFAQAVPMEPDEAETKMELPSHGDDSQVPAGFRPVLKHTTTVPVGRFNDFIHAAQTSPPQSGSPVRDSVTSLIDLDLGFADPADLVRPSTASSASGSTTTEKTSGNPFDLEEDPEQNEIDRNRFSYHKQWQSEGGQMKRRSHKTVPMHSRGSSLTSTDSESNHHINGDGDGDESGLNYDYEAARRAAFSGRPSLMVGQAHDELDMNHWPDFGPDSSLDEEPALPRPYGPRPGDADFVLKDRERTNGVSAYSFSRPQAPSRSGNVTRGYVTVEPIPPHPEALKESAAEEVVVEEIDRLLDEVQDALQATSRALREHTGFVEDEEETDEDGSVTSSNNAPLGDGDGL